MTVIGTKSSITDRLAPTEGERRTLVARGAELDASLQEAGEEAVIRRVAVLLAAFPAKHSSDVEKRSILKLYGMALGKYPEWVIDQCCRDCNSGKVGKGEFAPTPAAMAKACEEIAVPVRAEAHQIAQILQAEVYHENTPEERERMAAGFADLMRDLARPSAHPRSPSA